MGGAAWIVRLLDRLRPELTKRLSSHHMNPTPPPLKVQGRYRLPRTLQKEPAVAAAREQAEERPRGAPARQERSGGRRCRSAHCPSQDSPQSGKDRSP